MHPSRSSTVLLTAFVALLAAALLPSSPAVAAPTGGRTVIARLFEWKWPDVGRECARTLGPKGYGGVQAGARLTDWWTNGGDQVAFGRGGRGYVVVNRGSGALTRTFQTSLPRGAYCDVVHGEVRGGGCTGPAVTVDPAGRFTATVGATDALALHAGSRVRR